MVVYHEESQRCDEVGTWVRRGLKVGAKVLSIEPKDELPAGALSRLLQDRPEAVEAMGSGRIQVAPADRAADDPHVDRLIRILGADREQGFLTGALR
jgi:hypothetical protein